MGFAVKRKFILDTGQFAGSRGASGKAPPELRDADYLDSIGKTASIARHVRTKFYGPRKDGSEPFIDYARAPGSEDRGHKFRSRCGAGICKDA